MSADPNQHGGNEKKVTTVDESGELAFRLALDVNSAPAKALAIKLEQTTSTTVVADADGDDEKLVVVGALGDGSTERLELLRTIRVVGPL